MAGERSLPTPYAKESDRQVRQEQALSLRVKARDAGRRFWVRIATSRPQPQLRTLLSLSAPLTTALLLIRWEYASFPLAIALHVALSISLITCLICCNIRSNVCKRQTSLTSSRIPLDEFIPWCRTYSKHS